MDANARKEQILMDANARVHKLFEEKRTELLEMLPAVLTEEQSRQLDEMLKKMEQNEVLAAKLVSSAEAKLREDEQISVAVEKSLAEQKTSTSTTAAAAPASTSHSVTTLSPQESDDRSRKALTKFNKYFKPTPENSEAQRQKLSLIGLR